MTNPDPCSTCGAPGVRNLGTEGYCAHHLAALYATFDPTLFVDHGIGFIVGAMRPDFGPTDADLACNAPNCTATWVGTPCTPCPWCDQRRAARALIFDQDHKEARRAA